MVEALAGLVGLLGDCLLSLQKSPIYDLSIGFPIGLPVVDSGFELLEFFPGTTGGDFVREVAGEEDGRLGWVAFLLQFDFGDVEVELAVLEGEGEVEVGFDGGGS